MKVRLARIVIVEIDDGYDQYGAHDFALEDWNDLEPKLILMKDGDPIPIKRIVSFGVEKSKY